MPEMLPALVAPDSALRDEQIKYMEDLWQASVLAESEQDTGFGSQAVRKQIYWLDWLAAQWLLADHRGIATRSHHPHHEECRLSGVVVGEVRHADVASHSGVGSTYR